MASHIITPSHSHHQRLRRLTYSGRKRYRLPIITLRMPFQRFYVVDAPQLIHAVQSKANMSTFVPNLLDFGMLFSGLSKESRKVMKQAVDTGGNRFTQGVHKYLSAGHTLQVATRTAVDKLSASVPNNFAGADQTGLLDILRHDIGLALTGAVYGAENPYDDPEIEASWLYVSLFIISSPSHELALPVIWIWSD